MGDVRDVESVLTADQNTRKQDFYDYLEEVDLDESVLANCKFNSNAGKKAAIVCIRKALEARVPRPRARSQAPRGGEPNVHSLTEDLTRLTVGASKPQPAAAHPSATDLGVNEEKVELWRERGGGDLEPVLASGAVALLDSQWIISHAEAGGVLSHRQALPEEAFLSLADLVEATGGLENDELPVAALSYPWLTKDHPDPRGANLSYVAKVLKALLDNDLGLARLGVFWDFGSLHQHPDPVNGVMRTEEQNALFKQGLGCLGTLYSHPKTYVLRLTSFPDGHKAEDQAEGTNVAKYFDRGWCFTENSWSSLTKSGHLSLDLGLSVGLILEKQDYYCLTTNCSGRGGRRPPLLPSAFAAELEKKSFTNGKDDKPLVKRLYEAAFKEQFGKATELDYNGLDWGDAEAAQLAEVLASGAAPRLEKLFLMHNQVGDEGCKALAAALKEGAVSSLKARDAPPCHTRPSPAQCSDRASPRVQTLYVDNRKQPELVAVCKERGIKLRRR